MDFATIMQAVSTVGFPIVCCGVLFYQNSKLAQTIAELKETITVNTVLLQTISEKMKGDK